MRNHFIVGAFALGASALPQSRKSDHPVSAPGPAPGPPAPSGGATANGGRFNIPHFYTYEKESSH